MAIEEFGKSLLADVRKRKEDQARKARKREKKQALQSLVFKGVVGIGNTLLKDKADKFLESEQFYKENMQFKKGYNISNEYIAQEKEARNSTLGYDAYWTKIAPADQIDLAMTEKYGAESLYNISDWANMRSELMSQMGKAARTNHEKGLENAKSFINQAGDKGAEFYSNFGIAKKIFKEADERLNYPISKLIFEGPEDKLQLTENTQPAILTVSYSIFKVLRDEFGFELNTTKFFAGHSLGEYTALVCSESLNFNDALYLLHERGKAMQEAVPVGKGSMIAVLGTKMEEIHNLIKLNNGNDDDICEVANDNANGQLIISGDKKKIESLQLILKEKKIKSIPLKVSAPFHCSLMKPAANIMKDKINNTEFREPKFKIVNNVTAEPELNADTIKQLLVKQIYSTVRWRESIIKMQEAGTKNFIEVGPGKVLIGMVKRTLKDVNCFSINSIADIKNLTNEFKR